MTSLSNGARNRPRSTQPGEFTEFKVVLSRKPASRSHMSLFILVMDDEPDVGILLLPQLKRDLRVARFTMDFVQFADARCSISIIRWAMHYS